MSHKVNENMSDLLVYLDETEINPELKCYLCHMPFESPVNINKCLHTFCQTCIIESTMKYSNQCPVCGQKFSIKDLNSVTLRSFLNLLNQLMVKCKLCNQSSIMRGNFQDHLRTCPQQVISCMAADIKCPWKGKRNEHAQHFRKCVFERVRPIVLDFNSQIASLHKQVLGMQQSIVHVQEENKKLKFELERVTSSNTKKTAETDQHIRSIYNVFQGAITQTLTGESRCKCCGSNTKKILDFTHVQMPLCNRCFESMKSFESPLQRSNSMHVSSATSQDPTTFFHQRNYNLSNQSNRNRSREYPDNIKDDLNS